ncbi:MAG: phosphoglycerate dehydrogenase [Pseudonocardia sp.]
MIPAKAPLRALLAESIHPSAVATLERTGIEVATVARALSPAELVGRLGGIHLLGIRSTTHVTREVLAASPDLLAVGAFCIGTNQVDLAAASARGVAVFNAPFSNTRSVVEIALAEIVALYRRLTVKDRLMHEGSWDKSAEGSHEVRGRTLGIVGYGNIGSQLSVLAEAVGMSVAFYDVADKLALGNAAHCPSLDELLATADVVSLHVDGRAGNAGLFGREQFARMRPGSLFLNLSRGFVIDHEALRDHLVAGHLGGAAVDVFPDEPKGRGEEFRSVLRGLPNVILTPHVAGSTEEAQEDIGRFVAGKLADYLRTGSTMMSVNLPQLTLPPRAGGHRLAHQHTNTPGVMADINRVLASHGVNVDAQILATAGSVGYALTDVSVDYAAEVIAELRAMPATIRLQVLS